MLWKEKEGSRIRAVQMDNLRCLLSIRRMDRVLKAWIRELCRVKKGLDKRIDVSVLHFLAHVERIAKRVWGSMLAVVQWVGRGRDGLIPAA